MVVDMTTTSETKSGYEPNDNTHLDSEVIGSTIVSIRKMTADEMDSEGWIKNEIPIVLVLSSGAILYPSQDTEGNDAGSMFGKTSGGTPFGLY